MSLKVALFDPDEDIELLLSDIFEVTGHELFTANNEEDIKGIISQGIKLLILPFSRLKLWIDILKERPIIPIFIIREEEEEKLFKAGFNELNALSIPFNPLELLEKLGALDRLSAENFNELGFINTILKSFLEERSLNLVVSSEKGECCFKTYPLILCCEREKLRDILSENYNLEEFDGDIKDRNEESVAEIVEYLLEEEKKEEKPEEIKKESVEEFILLFWEEDNKGILRKNVYFLDLDGFYILVNLCPSKILRKLIRGLREKGIDFREIKLILLSDFDAECAEILRRVQASNPNVITIGREKLKLYLESLGLRNIKFRAVEDIPTSVIKIPSGYSIRLFPITPSPGFPSVAYFIEEKNTLFTGRFLGNFNSDDEELRKVFHAVYYPCEEFLKKNLYIFGEFPRDAKVFPWYGKPYELRDTVKVLSETDYPEEYPVDSEIVLTLLNRIFMFLDDEERENFVAGLRGMIEVEEGVPSKIYTSPNLVYDMSVKCLLNAVKDRKKFFDILKELSKYPFYIPSPEM